MVIAIRRNKAREENCILEKTKHLVFITNFLQSASTTIKNGRIEKLYCNLQQTNEELNKYLFCLVANNTSKKSRKNLSIQQSEFTAGLLLFNGFTLGTSSLIVQVNAHLFFFSNDGTSPSDMQNIGELTSIKQFGKRLENTHCAGIEEISYSNLRESVMESEYCILYIPVQQDFINLY